MAAPGRNKALRLNYRMALRKGAKVGEICEALFQVAACAGSAAAWDALELLDAVLQEDSA
ncbi:MAG: carboxymuconolactone decarboxylase family protein [Planctomycetaceae bacterium]